MRSTAALPQRCAQVKNKRRAWSPAITRCISDLPGLYIIHAPHCYDPPDQQETPKSKDIEGPCHAQAKDRTKQQKTACDCAAEGHCPPLSQWVSPESSRAGRGRVLPAAPAAGIRVESLSLHTTPAGHGLYVRAWPKSKTLKDDPAPNIAGLAWKRGLSLTPEELQI